MTVAMFTHKKQSITYRTIVTGTQVLAFANNVGNLQTYAFLFHYPGYVSVNGSNPTTMTLFSAKWAPGAPTTKMNSVFDDFRVVKMQVRVRTYVQGSIGGNLSQPGGSGFMDLVICHDSDSYLASAAAATLLNDGACRTLPLMNGGGKQMKYITTSRHTCVPRNTWFDTNNAVPIAYNATTGAGNPLAAFNQFPAALEPFATTQVIIPAAQNFSFSAVNLAVGDVEVKWFVEFRGENIVR